ncbi:bile acid:sodium symporter family protein [Photobacterium damselae]|uniref:bile acid:sodium symporter family protein n=1 Tax=Photobacterium damselae TaxID=38293 RepID=UPI000D05D5ED|nr:bile acid:sodium symporter family protein [Photobacterium damselae]MCG3845413.1 bile acid:sodium symporter family protein [Photobacterium damselae]PSB86264.1 sodium-dependent transporter [Photobacterium damselae subsp. damselae]UJZ96034.1 bile acid:sodium symporter family protein [Photobacterium damselae subsp. damselae]UKA00062.1 bile acid:sodium symporter family protein [Photobacterium damselae subsp. damselae]UKA12364.1 bile acid:sodium symporter family protein [Photobacterium damselae s
MQHIVTQVLLPITLAIVMLGMGLGLKRADFSRVITQPKSSIIGLCLQIFMLPALALVLIQLLPLSSTAAAGLFLVSLCPGGATSNLFSLIAKGDVALSITLTAVISLLSPFLLPLVFITYLDIHGSQLEQFQLPIDLAIKQLIAVTVLPISLGMIITKWLPKQSQLIQPMVKKLSTIAMLLIILALLITNQKIFDRFISIEGIAVLLLSSCSLFLAYFIAGKIKVSQQAQRTIAIEVGVQNAGTAMMVALSIMHQPQLAVVPLMYGLLMNIPACLFVAWVSRKSKL